MQTFKLGAPPPFLHCEGLFDQSCEIELSEKAIESLVSRKAKLRILARVGNRMLGDARIEVRGAISGRFLFGMGSNGCQVTIGGGVGGNWIARMWRGSTVKIGDQCTANDAQIVCNNSTVSLGEDCMLSTGVFLQSADQHGIVDLSRGEIINDAPQVLAIADHVWLGRDTSVMPGASIGAGSIIGLGAIVTGNIPARSLAVGVPARVIRNEVTWSRQPDRLDAYSRRLTEQARGTAAA